MQFFKRLFKKKSKTKTIVLYNETSNELALAEYFISHLAGGKLHPVKLICEHEVMTFKTFPEAVSQTKKMGFKRIGIFYGSEEE